MSSWSFGAAHSQQLNNDVGPYVETDWSMPTSASRQMRFWFNVINGIPGDPVEAANFTMQVDLGAGFVTWESAKTISPGRTEGVNIIVPEFIFKTFSLGIAGVLPIRLEVEWPGGPYYSNTITVTTESATWFESTAPLGGFGEKDAPVNANAWGEGAAPVNANAWGEGSAPINANSWAETKCPANANAWAEKKCPANANSWAEGAAPINANSWDQKDAPVNANSWSEKDAPANANSWDEKDGPVNDNSWGEGAAPVNDNAWTEGTN